MKRLASVCDDPAMFEDQNTDALLRTFYYYQHKTTSIMDDDDYDRLGRIINKAHSPQNIFHLATEGLI
jgi:hypothetical protein